MALPNTVYLAARLLTARGLALGLAAGLAVGSPPLDLPAVFGCFFWPLANTVLRSIRHQVNRYRRSVRLPRPRLLQLVLFRDCQRAPDIHIEFEIGLS